MARPLWREGWIAHAEPLSVKHGVYLSHEERFGALRHLLSSRPHILCYSILPLMSMSSPAARLCRARHVD